jgi:photosystem II stability/assembly factor-like uncharacterized protein
MTISMKLKQTATLIVSAALMMLVACKKDEDKSPGPGTGGGGAWLVGQDGTMINVPPDGLEIGGYDLDVDDDLLDIACRGAETAWVVGEGGTVLRTTDRGASWQAIDLSTTRALTTVAASDREVVVVAGAGGIALRSEDSGDTWVDLDGGSAVFTSSAVRADGAIALFGDEAGALWRWEGTLSNVHVGELAVRGVSMSADGRHAVAVGDDGLILDSVDGGRTWQQVDAGFAGALHDVWVTSDGARAFAVGDDAQLLLLDAAGTEVRQLLADAPALRGIHLAADGSGMIVGELGTGLITADHGATWTQVPLGTTRTLHAVDDIHPVPHE